MKTGPAMGSLKDEVLNQIGLMGRQRICFDDDADAQVTADAQEKADAGGEADEIKEGDWRLGISEEFRADPSLKDYRVVAAGTKNDKGEDLPEVKLVQVPETFVKSHINMQKLIGGDKVVIPKEGDPPEVQVAFRKAMGIPEDPAKYDLPKDPAWEQIPYSPELEAWFRKSAHAHNVPAGAATEMFKEYQGEMKGIFTRAQAAKDKLSAETIKSLDDKWGDKSKENTALADRAFITIFGPEASKAGGMYDLILGDDAFFIEKMFEVSKLFGEDKLAVSEGTPGSGIKTRAELDAMIADPRYQTDSAYRAEVTALFKKLYP